MGKKLLTSSELMKIENEILVFIKNMCEKNDIKYYLSGGTALGAVRHGGFIPWDDDVDIYMYREDYNKFREIMKANDTSPYELLYIDTSKTYTLPLPKVIDSRTVLTQTNQREVEPIGVYVDLFILDNVPDNEAERNSFIRKMNCLLYLWHLAQMKGDDDVKSLKKKVKKIVKEILWIIGPRYFAKKIDHFAKMYSKCKTSYCGNMTYSCDLNKAVTRKDIYGEGILLSFEGVYYNAPEKIDEYLTNLYGDYMQFPPIEQRISHHYFEAYYRE